MALSLDNHFSIKGVDALSSGVRIDEDEPNCIFPEKRSKLKYSPLRPRMVFRSRAVHDLREDFACSTDVDCPLIASRELAKQQEKHHAMQDPGTAVAW